MASKKTNGKTNGKTKKSSKKEKKTHDCLCGCGEQCTGKRRFRQGHDATLRSRVLKHARGIEKSRFTGAQIEWAMGSHWMTKEIAAELPTK